MTALAQFYALYSHRARSFNQWQRALYPNFIIIIFRTIFHVSILRSEISSLFQLRLLFQWRRLTHKMLGEKTNSTDVLMSLLPPLYLKFLTFCILFVQKRKKKWNQDKNWHHRASLVFREDTRSVESIFVCFVSPERYYCRGDRTKAINKSYTQIFLKFLFYYMIDKSWKKN